MLIAVAAGATAYVFWRLQTGPLTLGPFKHSAELAVEAALPPHHDAAISQAWLQRGDEKGEINLILSGVSVTSDAAAEPVAELSRLDLGFAFSDLFRGALGPRSVLVVDPELRIERGADKTFSLEFAKAGRDVNFVKFLTGGRFFHGAFKVAELKGARVYFRDVPSGRIWRAENAEARIIRDENGYQARLTGVFDINGRDSSLDLAASYTEQSDVIAAKLDVEDAPVGDLLQTFFGAGDALLSAPLTGEATLEMTGSGQVLHSRLTGRAGEGILSVAGKQYDVSEINVDAAFNPESNEFDLERMTFNIHGSSGVVDGKFAVRFGAGALDPKVVDFKLNGSDLLIDTKGFLSEPLAVERLAAKGAYDVEARRLNIDEAEATLLDVSIAGMLSYAAPPGQAGAPAIAADLKVEGALDPPRILAGWPQTLGLGARDFVATRLPEATVENVAFKLDLPADRPTEGPMPDGALTLTFDIRDATTYYSPTMTPLTNASGHATLSGNRFLIENVRGRAGKIAIGPGEVDFTALSPKAQPVHFRFAAKGEASDILEILNEEPLSVLKSTGISTSRFVGDLTADIDIMRPNLREVPREEYGLSGDVKFGDLTFVEFYRGTDLAHAEGEIDLATRSMNVTAKAELGGSPITLDWTQQFYGAGPHTSATLTGVVNSATGDVFGVPTRQFLRGPVPFDAVAKGELNALDSLDVSLDLSNAALAVDAFGWRKPADDEAAGKVAISFNEAGMALNAFSIMGDGIEIRGGASFGERGVIQIAALDRFYLRDGADFTLTAERLEDGPLDVALTGPFINAGRLVESVVEERPGGEQREPIGWGEGLVLRARVDELQLRRDALYRDASLDFRRGPERIQALEFSALTKNSGAPLAVLLNPTGAAEGPTQIVEARTDDIGTLLQGVFGVTSIRGGEGSMQILIDPRERGNGRDLSGILEARSIRVVNAPLLTRIFAAGSLTGLADLVNDEGIALNDVEAKFGFNDGLLRLDEARATGPSVGITGAGSIQAGEAGAIALNGAVAPAYQVNSLLGKTPVIGDLLVGREGEGIVALSYSVRGSSNAPAVTVNPLSALAPGIFRRMFEPGPAMPKSTPDTDNSPPSEAEPAPKAGPKIDPGGEPNRP